MEKKNLGAAAAIGGKTSVINLCLHYIPVKLLVPGVFMMCCFISTAIGTSMGTMAAMAQVALGVAEGAGLNPAIVCAAVIGGSYFGDNLSMISDTTIAAAALRLVLLTCSRSRRNVLPTW